MTLENESCRADVDLSAHVLRITAANAALLAPFEGVAAEGHGGQVLEGPLSARNAAALRERFPHLQPALIGSKGTSAGTGDRLGLATPGHVDAFRAHGGTVTPVLAQQSIREMDRLGRDAQEVMDGATFGAVTAGWEEPFGADCDHIKTTAGIDRGLEAGFTMFTLDPGDHVVDVRPGLAASAVRGNRDRPGWLLRADHRGGDPGRSGEVWTVRTARTGPLSACAGQGDSRDRGGDRRRRDCLRNQLRGALLPGNGAS